MFRRLSALQNSRNYFKGLHHWESSVFPRNLRFSKLSNYCTGVPDLHRGKFLAWLGGPPTMSCPGISMITDAVSQRFNNKERTLFFGALWHMD